MYYSRTLPIPKEHVINLGDFATESISAAALPNNMNMQGPEIDELALLSGASSGWGRGGHDMGLAM